jgi:hypothetical protein
MKLSWGLLLLLGFGADGKKKGGKAPKEDKGPKTANQKLKKLTRDTVKIMNILFTTDVSKSDYVSSLDTELNGRGKNGRKDETGMISAKLYKRMTKKYLNQVKYIRKKINSNDCLIYAANEAEAKEMQLDAYDVWGEESNVDTALEELYLSNLDEKKDSILKLNMTQIIKWTDVPEYLMPENLQAVRGINSGPLSTKPLTLLNIQFMKTRLFIEEYVGKCYDDDKAKDVDKPESTEKRISQWVTKGQKKFNTMEERVCKNMWKGLIRTSAEDNPYIGLGPAGSTNASEDTKKQIAKTYCQCNASDQQKANKPGKYMECEEHMRKAQKQAIKAAEKAKKQAEKKAAKEAAEAAAQAENADA